MIRAHGHFDGTAIVLDDPVDLPVGVELDVTLEPKVEPEPQAEEETVWQRLARIGRQMPCEGLPEDLAEHHDHYLHGRPKR